MADACSSGLMATLAPVVVGGLIGLAGGWLGPWLLERRKEAAEKKQRRAQKFEELVAALYEFDHWIDIRRQIDAFSKESADAISPFYKLEAISSVHFPQFIPRITTLDQKAAGYRVWMTEAGQKRLRGEIDGMDQGLLEACRPYADARNTLLKELKQFAQDEFA